MAGGAPPREALTLRGPAGLIEALLDEPAPESRRGAVAVICHPHPLHQGTMLNKVVHTLSRAMNDLGVPAIRFNFRGVGASEGAYADGLGEAEDVAAVAAWAGTRYPGTELWLAGFSFGAAVAIRAARDLRPAWLVSIAPPVARMASLVEGIRPPGRWLVVQGSADKVVPADDVIHWAEALEPPPDLVVLPDVDHFFHGRLSLLRETLLRKLDGAQS
jgi:alpha/beta superfamily hydrolase